MTVTVSRRMVHACFALPDLKFIIWVIALSYFPGVCPTSLARRRRQPSRVVCDRGTALVSKPGRGSPPGPALAIVRFGSKTGFHWYQTVSSLL